MSKSKLLGDPVDFSGQIPKVKEWLKRDKSKDRYEDDALCISGDWDEYLSAAEYLELLTRLRDEGVDLDQLSIGGCDCMHIDLVDADETMKRSSRFPLEDD